MKQDWNKIEEQMNLRKESKIDLMIAKSFWKAGWEVYPEAGHRFQIKRDYEDCTHIDGISNNEAKELWIEFLRATNDEEECKEVAQDVPKGKKDD